MNNGLLPVVVSPDFLREIFASVEADAGATITIDLPAQTIRNNATGRSEYFDINAYKKNCLVNGLDDIDYLLANQSKIEAYERNRKP
jgi:3-isopropylmalate/(R)-2-methylmalate dehydratase small subunit